MRPSAHTLLINCVIGFCKKSDSWVYPLYDLGYEPVIIEQRIPLSQEVGAVRPDVIVHSNKLVNSLVFDCKGGITVDPDQLERYSKLISRDLLSYVDVFSRADFTHEVCFVDLETNHRYLLQSIRNFPILVLGEHSIQKSGNFRKRELEETFRTPIILDRSKIVEPVSYYPFSELDDRGMIIKEVLRAIITILRNHRRQAFAVLNPATYENQDILKTIHPLYELLSLDQRGVLMQKINGIITQLRRDYPDFAEKVRTIQSEQAGQIAITNLIKICEDIMVKEERNLRLDDF